MQTVGTEALMRFGGEYLGLQTVTAILSPVGAVASSLL